MSCGGNPALLLALLAEADVLLQLAAADYPPSVLDLVQGLQHISAHLSQGVEEALGGPSGGARPVQGAAAAAAAGGARREARGRSGTTGGTPAGPAAVGSSSSSSGGSWDLAALRCAIAAAVRDGRALPPGYSRTHLVARLRFVYQEGPHRHTFFLPYAWSLATSSTPIAWNASAVLLFEPTGAAGRGAASSSSSSTAQQQKDGQADKRDGGDAAAAAAVVAGVVSGTMDQTPNGTKAPPPPLGLPANQMSCDTPAGPHRPHQDGHHHDGVETANSGSRWSLSPGSSHWQRQVPPADSIAASPPSHHRSAAPKKHGWLHSLFPAVAADYSTG